MQKKKKKKTKQACTFYFLKRKNLIRDLFTQLCSWANYTLLKNLLA